MLKEKKTILFLFYRECSFLPPFMTVIDSLCEDYNLKVISCEKYGEREKLLRQYEGKDVDFISHVSQPPRISIFTKIKWRIKKNSFTSNAFRKEAVKLLNTTPYDLLWVIHEQTAFEFNNALRRKEFVISFYELNDHRQNVLKAIKPLVQSAKQVMVPEYNRACILRVWLNLQRTPTVIPNKPLGHPRQRNIPNSYSTQLEGKKIILYQGYIIKSRSIDKICEAVKDMPDYRIVLMGKGDESYIQELKNKYPQIIHISFIVPPEHLYVTSWAHIAIVKYDFVALNAIFCAPNKTWEYTGFGIPVLCHNIPGLQYTIGQYKAGVCADLDDVESIQSAITEIDKRYDEYSQNAVTFYNSCDIKEIIKSIVENNLL